MHPKQRRHIGKGCKLSHLARVLTIREMDMASAKGPWENLPLAPTSFPSLGETSRHLASALLQVAQSPLAEQWPPIDIAASHLAVMYE